MNAALLALPSHPFQRILLYTHSLCAKYLTEAQFESR